MGSNQWISIGFSNEQTINNDKVDVVLGIVNADNSVEIFKRFFFFWFYFKFKI
jgi:hypothetical protein